MVKALFLDRDGTIIEGIRGNENNNNDELGYLTKVEDVRLIEGVDIAISKARELGYKVLIITNQSAIARGFITEEDLHNINQRMYELLALHTPTAIIDDLFYCPYYIDGVIEKYKKESNYRKPGVGMIIEAKKKYDIDIASSYFIGDSYTDMKCGDNAGLKKILVLTGYGIKSYRKCIEENIKIDFFAKDLLDAVRFIERREKMI